LDKAPSQQSIWYVWKQFSQQTKRTLNAAATGIAQEAVDRGVILEARVPIIQMKTISKKTIMNQP